MYFVPLTQLESVELLIHSLKAAGGEADCSVCPVRKVCMKQCLTIASSVEQMLENGALPEFNGSVSPEENPPDDDKPQPPTGGSSGQGGLRVVK